MLGFWHCMSVGTRSMTYEFGRLQRVGSTGTEMRLCKTADKVYK